ncbi:MAG: family 78 glycoside hydrolase catalytic domain, partial [Oscillospiraceae bacterium]
AIGVILGNGYFKTEYHATANRILQFILQLEVLYENGETETIVSDMDGWRSSTNGALRTAGVYDGEVYDANRRLVGFSETSFCERASDNWKNVIITAPPCEKLTAQNMEPIRITEEICAAEIHIINPQTYVVDFGQNMAGFINLNVCGEKNTEIIMEYAELLYDDNRVNMENIRAAKATDVYILNGEGNESYRPRFTYHGFRYVQIEVNGRINSFSSENIMALRIHSDVEKSGEFSCSDEFINRLQRCCVNTERSNLHGLPTDCPQRDERMGWLNDMTVRAEEAIYNYKLVNVYEKWMQDILEKQDSLGAVCDTAPQSRFGRFPADPVCCSLILVPWLCFLHYGDRKILRDCYSGMKKWAGYLDSISENNIIAFTSYGDWASPIGQGEKGSCGSAVSAATPGSLVSTAFFYLSAKLISKIAGILDEKSDQAQYSEKAAEIYGAFQKEFYSREHGCYGFIKEIGGSQASQAIALRFSLVPAEHKSAVLKYLVNDIKNKNDFHFTTGNICTKYLIEVLAENGEVETAMALLKQTTYPGFGYMLSMGATTIWERWEHATTGFLAEMGSHNHPMYASIGSWFYCALAGIRLNENSEGFEIFEIRPFFPNGMQFAEARINTIKGDLFCRWDRNNKKVTLKLQVPYNSRAILLLPNTEKRTISSGEHNIQFEIY